MDDTLHEILRRNVVTATRNYQARVQSLMQEIIRHPSNPLSVKHFATKLEFQARGAGHNHGVLWLDIDRLQQKVDIRKLKDNYTGNDSYLKDPMDVPELNTYLTDKGYTPDKTPSKRRKHKALQYLDILEHIGCKVNLTEEYTEHCKELRQMFPLYGLSNVLKKIQENEEINEEELEKVIFLVDSFSTVSLHPAIVGEIVAEIVKKVNQHHHTHTCRKYKTICRFKMPKLPSYKTIIARPPVGKLSEEEKGDLQKKYEAIIKEVKKVLDNEEVLKNILNEYPKENENTKAEADMGRRKRIDAVLEKAGMSSTEDKVNYEKALSFNLSGYTVVYARDIDELMVNPYNPEITMHGMETQTFSFALIFI